MLIELLDHAHNCRHAHSPRVLRGFCSSLWNTMDLIIVIFSVIGFVAGNIKVQSHACPYLFSSGEYGGYSGSGISSNQQALTDGTLYGVA